ncbi:brain and acute leukemia cytoplasmic protein-like [Protopterus annectens]|uniref:brain and acute leukemia cytoplasmic protein-like n=1 Tax=Protopterus annectens TaxID=7888 RepID=UPI001CFB9E77|nr:brain and acute leukemia cytoplasmic protein-like [Protopterus annectens]
MGCGGSRTDALEPTYPESLTKETESTWLRNTDTDIPLSSIHNIPSDNSSESDFISEKSNLNAVADFFDDGLPAQAQAYLKICTTISEPVLSGKKPMSGKQTSKKQATSSHLRDSAVQKCNVVQTGEVSPSA